MQELWPVFYYHPFIPHEPCYSWQPGLLGLHLVSDFLIAIASFSIPLTLIYFIRQRQDIPFKGIFLLFTGSESDISDRKRIEKALKESETHYRSIVEDQTELICRFLPDSTILFVNEAYCRYFGIQREEIIGKSYAPVIFPGDLESVNQKVQSMSVENPNVTIENRVVVNGEIRWTQWINRMLFDEQGQLMEFQSVGRDITNLKETEEALRISEERLKLALEGSGNGLWDWNLLTGELYLSSQWLEMLGYAKNELPYRTSTWEQLIHPEDKPWVMELINAHLKNCSDPYSFDYRLLTKSGEWKWVANYGKVVAWDESGTPLRMVGTHQDISERKQTEEQLRRLSERLTLALKSGGFGIWEYDFAQGKQIWDDRMYELYGVTPANFFNTFDSWLSHIHPDDRDRLLQTMQEVTETDKEYDTEFRIVRPSGEICFLKTSGILQRDDQGRPVRIIGVNSDITERKLAEEALKESERRFATLAEASPVGIFRFDAASNCIYVNDHCCEMTGRPIQAMLGIGWLETLHPEDRDLVSLAWSQAFEQQEFYRGENRFLRPDGSIIWYYCQALPETDLNGTFIGYIGTLTDITSRKNTELELRSSRDLREAIFNESADALFLVDPETRLNIDCNRRAVELFEADDKPELLGIEGNTFQYHQFSPDDLAAISLELQSNGFWSREIEYFTCQGNLFWGNIAAKPITVAGRTLNLVRVTDISDRKQAEEALAKYAREVEDLYNNAPCGYHSLDIEGRIVKVNDTELQWLGYTCEEVIGRPLTDFITEAGCSFFRENYHRFQVQGRLKDIELDLICKDGTLFPVLIDAIAVKSGDGQYLYSRSTLFDLRDRKQAEQTVQELNAAMQNAVEGISRLDKDGRYISVNRAYANMCGYEPEELIGQLWQQTVHSEDIPNMLAAYQQMLQTGKVNAETRGLRKDGSIFYKQVTMITARDRNGNVMGNHCFLKDISDRKHAEAIIKKQAQRELLLRVITQRVHQTLDLDVILTSVVTEVRETFQADRALIFRLLPEGKGQVLKEAVLPPYIVLGEGSWIDKCLQPENINYYRIGQPRIVADVALDEWGQCLGKFLNQIGVRSKISAPITQTLENGEAQIWGFLIVHVCNTYRQWLPEEAGLLQQISNQLAIAIQQADLYQRVQMELTERKLAEERLQQTNDQLAHTNIELARATRLKDEFLANMSHELRTPLNAILGMSEGLQESVFGSINEQQAHAIALVERSGRHLLELINDILDLSKIESGKLELQITDVSVKSLCDASLAFIKQIALKKNISLRTRIPNNLGSIQADDRRLRQMLINLLSNAVKFTPDGGSVTLEVRLEPAEEHQTEKREITQLMVENSQPSGEALESISALSSFSHQPSIPSSSLSLCFSITDTGIGISRENMDKLFQPFVQIDSSLNRQNTGTGLGLALVQRIVALHGGTVSLDSQVGQGSCFTIRIPYPSTNELARVQVNTPLSSHSFSVDNTQVFIIEDSTTTADQIARYLNEYGMQPLFYRHGQGALEEVLRLQPALVILDIQLPDLSGWNVLTQLKSHPQTQSIPVFIVSVVDEHPQGLAMGASEYLVKPLTRDEFQAALKKLHCPIVSQSNTFVNSPAPASKTPLILLAEDNQANIDTIAGYLESRGYRMVLANNGQQAIELTKLERPNIILMDIQMPGMDGLEAIRRIRSEGYIDVPIIALTALAMPGDREKCLEAGANEYVTKPLRLKQLTAMIQKLL